MSGNWIDLGNAAATAWAEAMLRACWQGGLLALVAWGLCRLARRIPARLCVAIWLMVCLKMFVGLSPLSVALPVLPPETVAQYVPAPSGTAIVSYLPTASAEPAPNLSSIAYVGLVWGVGVLAILGVATFALFRLKGVARRAAPVADPEVLAMAAETARLVGLATPPRLLSTDSEVGALTIGAFKPVVLLSNSVLESCSPEELRLVLAHEFAHLRRHDAWLALAPQVMTALFFFHPFAWLAAREFELARESACDEMAINALGARSDMYGRLLLKLGSQRPLATPFFALRMSPHFRILSRRITMLNQVSNRSTRARGALFLSLGLALVAPWNLVPAQAAQTHQHPITVKNKVVKSKNIALKNKVVKTKRIDVKIKVSKKGHEVVKPKGEAPALAAKKAQTEKRYRVETVYWHKPATQEKNVYRVETVHHLKPEDATTPQKTNTSRVVFEIKPGDLGKLTCIALKNVSASVVADELRSRFASDGAFIGIDANSNSVILKGPDNVLERMIQVVKDMDKPKVAIRKLGADSTKEVKKYPLRYVSSQSACDALKQNGDLKDIDFLSYDPTDNSIVVRATKEAMVKVEAFLAKLDVKS